MHRSQYLLVLLGTLGLSTLAADASAQPVPATSPTSGDVQTDKARELHLEADGFYKKGEYAKARASYLAAWALKKHWQIAGSLADCEVKLGLDREAAEHFAYYFRHLPQGQTPSASAKKLYGDAKSKTGAITVQVSERGADVKVDGVLVGTSPIEDPVFVAPGKHAVEARLGSKIARTTLDANVGVPASASLELKNEEPVQGTPTASATAVDTAIPRLPAPRSKVPGFLFGGAGIAALIAGAGLYGGGEGKKGEVSSTEPRSPDGKPVCPKAPPASGPDAHPACAQLRSTAREGNTLTNTGIALFALGGTAVAGAVVYLLWPNPTSPTNKPASRVAPVVSADGAGLVWVGSF